MIGIKLADGSFYPVLEEGVPKTKKLTLTTAKDNQETVRIVLVRGKPGARGKDLGFIRELFLSGLLHALEGEPDIELTLSLDKDLILRTRLNPLGWAGSSQSYEAPRGPKGRIKRKRRKSKGSPYYGVTLKYRESGTPSAMSDEEFAATGVYIRPNAVSLTAFVLLGFFICAVLAFLFFLLFKAPLQPPLAQALLFPFCFPKLRFQGRGIWPRFRNKMEPERKK
jgi:hypothetical protein